MKIHGNYMLKEKNMKKQYIKPTMQAYDLKMTQMLCQSADPYRYPGPFGYIPAHHVEDETLMA